MAAISRHVIFLPQVTSMQLAKSYNAPATYHHLLTKTQLANFYRPLKGFFAALIALQGLLIG